MYYDKNKVDSNFIASSDTCFILRSNYDESRWRVVGHF